MQEEGWVKIPPFSFDEETGGITLIDTTNKNPNGIFVPYNDNPLLIDPGIRFVEEMYVATSESSG